MRFLPVLAACLAFLAASAHAHDEPRTLTAADVEAWLDGILPYALARDDVAGAVAVVVKDGEILALEGYGHADVAKKTPVDPAATLFRTGSVGKLFTWTAVMQLVEAGKLDLDRDVNDYLDFRIPPRDGEPVTLRNLMTHTPGFEEVVKQLVTDRPEQLLTAGEFVKAHTPERIFPPGQVPSYSNYGVTLAGYLVERVSGESYDDYVDGHVLGPLGMARSSTRQSLPPALAPHMSQGYMLGSGPAKPFERFGVSPAGGATTTGADMARFMIAWLQEGEFGSARILKPETARHVLGTRLPVIPALNSMLLGFFEQNLNGRRVAGHRGDTQFFHGTLNLFVDEGVGVYFVMNSSGRDNAAINLPAAFMAAFADRYFPAPLPAASVSEETAAEHARLMTGTYMSSRRQESNFFSLLNFLTQMKVGLDADGGILIPALLDFGGQPMRWREVRPFEWQHVGGKERLAARVDDGRVTMFSVDSVSPFLVLQPAPWWKSSALLSPLLLLSLLTILATVVAWPAGAILRRRYGAKLALAADELRIYRWVRVASIAALAVAAGWAGVIGLVAGGLFAFSPALDPWITLLRLATLIACAGGVGAALWNARIAWARRGWGSRCWSALLVLSFATLSWFSVACRLAGFGTDY